MEQSVLSLLSSDGSQHTCFVVKSTHPDGRYERRWEAAHEDAAPRQHQRRQWGSLSRRRTGHGDAQFAEVDIGTITGAPPVTITISDQDFGRYGGVRTRDAGRRPSRPWSSGDQRDAGYHADRGSGWSKARLGSGKTAEGKGKALDAPMAQKKTDDAMAETCEANDGVELARKKGGPKTGLSTNMEMLLHNLTLTLSTMWSEAVKVVEKIEEEVCGTMRNAETAAHRKTR